jgi:hypothetical protein
MKKNPVKGSFTDDEDAWFEAMELHELGRLPTSAWESAPGFWRMLPKARRATRRRLLVYLLQLCTDRGDTPPRQLVDRIGRELKISKSPRARVHDPAKLQEAARFQARNPGESLAKIATAVGIPGKATTILGFRDNPKFKSYLSDEQFLLELPRAKAAIAPTELSGRITVIEEEDGDGCVFTKTAPAKP